MLQALFDVALILAAVHVDEIDHNQAAKVAQAHLAGNFFSGFEVGVERRFFDVAAAGGTRRVDVDGGERFSAVDDNRAARGQPYFALMGRFNLAFNLIARKQRHLFRIKLEFIQVIRHGKLHLLARGNEDFFVVNHDFIDVGAQIIAQRPQQNIVFLEDQEWRVFIGRGFGNGRPVRDAMVEVPLQFFDAAPDAIRSNDQAHAIGQVQGIEGGLGLLALVTLGTPRHAARFRVIGHQHQIAPGEADIGGQRSAFVAAFFFFDLNNDFQPLAELGLVTVVKAGCDLFQRQKAVAFAAVFDKTGFK